MTKPKRRQYVIGSKPSPIRDVVMACLKENGPMTVPELMDALEMPRRQIYDAITGARQQWPGKMIRILRWVDPKSVGSSSKRYLAVFSASPGPDADPIDLATKEHRQSKQNEYRAKRRALILAQQRRNYWARKGVAAPAINPWQGLGQR